MAEWGFWDAATAEAALKKRAYWLQPHRSSALRRRLEQVRVMDALGMIVEMNTTNMMSAAKHLQAVSWACGCIEALAVLSLRMTKCLSVLISFKFITRPSFSPAAQANKGNDVSGCILGRVSCTDVPCKLLPTCSPRNQKTNIHNSTLHAANRRLCHEQDPQARLVRLQAQVGARPPRLPHPPQLPPAELLAPSALGPLAEISTLSSASVSRPPAVPVPASIVSFPGVFHAAERGYPQGKGLPQHCQAMG